MSQAIARPPAHEIGDRTFAPAHPHLLVLSLRFSYTQPSQDSYPSFHLKHPSVTVVETLLAAIDLAS